MRTSWLSDTACLFSWYTDSVSLGQAQLLALLRPQHGERLLVSPFPNVQWQPLTPPARKKEDKATGIKRKSQGRQAERAVILGVAWQWLTDGTFSADTKPEASLNGPRKCVFHGGQCWSDR